MNPSGWNTSQKAVISIFLLGVLSVLGSYLFIDRPLAVWTHSHLHGVTFFQQLPRIQDAVILICGVALVVMASAACLGWHPDPKSRSALTVILAVLAAATVKEGLKFCFGRTWPETWTNNNPSFITDGVYGFFPLHGGHGWMSFPSGHTTIMTALTTSAWYAFPRLRSINVVATIIVVIGLIGADFHWLSDILSGAILGSIVGLGMSGLVSQSKASPI